MRKFAGAILIGVIFAAAAFAQSRAATPSSVTVKMTALNDSGENGTAVITQEANGVEVAVSLTGAPAGVPQPTHIHIGTCGNINKAPEYGLRMTVDGKGSSTVPGVTLTELLKGHYAINVHKSGSALGTYVSCGNIVAP